MSDSWSIEIPMAPVSLKNRGQILRKGRSGRRFFAKSKEAQTWIDAACIYIKQRPIPYIRMGDKLRMDVQIAFPNRLRDLNTEIIKDTLQKARVIPNDRHIRVEFTEVLDKLGDFTRITLTVIGELPWKPNVKGWPYK